MTVIISLYYKETNETVLFNFLLRKSSRKVKLGEFKRDQEYFAK